MAELDIKDIWNKGSVSLGKEDELDVDAVIGKKSKTVLTKIRFILRIEFWLNNILLPTMTIVYFLKSGLWTALLTGVFGLVYFLYYRFLINAINKFDYSGNVRQSLTKVYRYLKFYLLHYKVMLWLSILGAFWAGMIVGIYNHFTGQFEELVQNAPEFESGDIHISLIIGMVLVVPVIIAGGLHALIDYLYGKKIRKLKRIVDDLGKD